MGWVIDECQHWGLRWRRGGGVFMRCSVGVMTAETLAASNDCREGKWQVVIGWKEEGEVNVSAKLCRKLHIETVWTFTPLLSASVMSLYPVCWNQFSGPTLWYVVEFYSVVLKTGKQLHSVWILINSWWARADSVKEFGSVDAAR